MDIAATNIYSKGTVQPRFILEYKSKDISDFISPYYEEITFVDLEDGESDEITITLEDSQKIWREDWYPQKGSSLKLFIGYWGEKLLPCGEFSIDEIEIIPQKVILKGISASIKKSLREKNTNNYQNTTLRKIIQSFAAKHNYTLVGNISDVSLRISMQNKKSDLSFIKDLAHKYGYNFKIYDNKLVFYNLEELEQASPVLKLSPTDLTNYSFRDKTTNTYKACSLSYFDPQKGKTIKVETQAKEQVTGDTLKINEKCSSKEDALLLTKSALKRNSRTIEGSISIAGNTKIFSGVIIEITGISKIIDGKYIVAHTTHKISKQTGYITEAEVRKIA